MGERGGRSACASEAGEKKPAIADAGGGIDFLSLHPPQTLSRSAAGRREGEKGQIQDIGGGSKARKEQPRAEKERVRRSTFLSLTPPSQLSKGKKKSRGEREGNFLRLSRQKFCIGDFDRTSRKKKVELDNRFLAFFRASLRPSEARRRRGGRRGFSSIGFKKSR